MKPNAENSIYTEKGVCVQNILTTIKRKCILSSISNEKNGKYQTSFRSFYSIDSLPFFITSKRIVTFSRQLQFRNEKKKNILCVYRSVFVCDLSKMCIVKSFTALFSYNCPYQLYTSRHVTAYE
jgi:hypothetical protein